MPSYIISHFNIKKIKLFIHLNIESLFVRICQLLLGHKRLIVRDEQANLVIYLVTN